MGYNRPMRKYPWLVVLTLGVLVAPAQTVRKPPPAAEEAVRARVDQFYSNFRDGKFRRAEALVAEESKDTFYAISKSKISDYKIESIDFDDSFQTAKVVVICESAGPHTHGTGMYLPVIGKWKLLDRDWYLVIEPRTTSPFGPIAKADGQEPKSPRRLDHTGAFSIEAFKGAFSVAPQKLVFPRQGDPVTQIVSVKNTLPGDLQIEVQGGDLPGLQLDLGNSRVPAKGDAAIQFTYDPNKGRLSGTREIRIDARPLNQSKIIVLQFE